MNRYIHDVSLRCEEAKTTALLTLYLSKDWSNISRSASCRNVIKLHLILDENCLQSWHTLILNVWYHEQCQYFYCTVIVNTRGLQCKTKQGWLQFKDFEFAELNGNQPILDIQLLRLNLKTFALSKNGAIQFVLQYWMWKNYCVLTFALYRIM